MTRLAAYTRLVLPLGLVALAVGAVWVVAFGTRAAAHDHEHLGTIVLARQLQWPLVGLALVMSLSLLALVITGKQRAWWLIGLAPVLALLTMRFGPSASEFSVLEDPALVQARSEAAPADEEWVVGIEFEDQPYAFPYRALFVRPMVVLTDYDKRMLLMWSGEGNRAAAFTINYELRPRELEIVARTHGSMLVLNRRYGEYFVAITGRTVDGRKPIGFVSPIPTRRTTFGAWRREHPQTLVMAIPVAGESAPSAPVAPRPPEQRVALVATTQPFGIASEVSIHEPVNLVAGETRVLMVRDGASGAMRAFDRRVADDLFPTFRAHRAPRHRDVAMIDSDTASLWTPDGRAVEGALKGVRLREIPVEEDLRLDVMRFWYPDLPIARAEQ